MKNSIVKCNTFSKWFLTLCDDCKVPIKVASGASTMMVQLSEWHWREDKRYVSCIACVRIGYKLVYDIVDMHLLLSMNDYTGYKKIDWITEECVILSELCWQIRQYFDPFAQVKLNNRNDDNNNDSIENIETKKFPRYPLKTIEELIAIRNNR